MKLQLNFNKPDNYAFYCPVSRIHLTRSNPVAIIDEVTPYIRRGLKCKSIIEIEENNATGQNPDTEKPKKAETPKAEGIKPIEVEEPKTKPSIEEPAEVVQNEEIKPETEEKVSAPVAEPSEKPKRGRQKKA